MSDSALTREQARNALVGARFAFAAGTWLAPRLSGKIFGIDLDDNRAGVYLARLFGTRDGYLGVEVLLADDDRKSAVLRRHVAVDAADAVASVAAGVRGGLSKPSALLGTLAALGAAGLGWYAAG
jgi:hypothetical protein